MSRKTTWHFKQLTTHKNYNLVNVDIYVCPGNHYHNQHNGHDNPSPNIFNWAKFIRAKHLLSEASPAITSLTPDMKTIRGGNLGHWECSLHAEEVCSSLLFMVLPQFAQKLKCQRITQRLKIPTGKKKWDSTCWLGRYQAAVFAGPLWGCFLAGGYRE